MKENCANQDGREDSVWILSKNDGEFARPLRVPRSEVQPGDYVFMRVTDLAPRSLGQTTVLRNKIV